MTYLTQGAFWAGAFERCVKTIAGSLLAGLGGNGTNMFDLDFTTVGQFALTAGAASLLLSILSAGVAGPAGSPSLVNDRPANSPSLPAPPE